MYREKRARPRLWVFQSKGLRRIFVNNREQVRSGRRKLRNGMLQNIFSFDREGNIKIISLRRIEWAEHAECKMKLRDNVVFVQAIKGY
jgi:hypothetical protein